VSIFGAEKSSDPTPKHAGLCEFSVFDPSRRLGSEITSHKAQEQVFGADVRDRELKRDETRVMEQITHFGGHVTSEGRLIRKVTPLEIPQGGEVVGTSAGGSEKLATKTVDLLGEDGITHQHESEEDIDWRGGRASVTQGRHLGKGHDPKSLLCDVVVERHARKVFEINLEALALSNGLRFCCAAKMPTAGEARELGVYRDSNDRLVIISRAF
jgi:hypothetical protein